MPRYWMILQAGTALPRAHPLRRVMLCRLRPMFARGWLFCSDGAVIRYRRSPQAGDSDSMFYDDFDPVKLKR